MGYRIGAEPVFDTVKVDVGPHKAQDVLAAALARRITCALGRPYGLRRVGFETVTEADLADSPSGLRGRPQGRGKRRGTLGAGRRRAAAEFARKSAYLAHHVFNKYHSETELMRYLNRLESKDISLTDAMIRSAPAR